MSNFIYDKNNAGTEPANTDVKNDRISGRFKKTITKREEEIPKVHQLIDQSQNVLNEQNKNGIAIKKISL